MGIIILLTLLVLAIVGAVITFFLKRKAEKAYINKASTISEFHPSTFRDYQAEIKHNLEVLEKLDGNIQKEKAEPIMKWAGKK